ncbi:hypothetical protein QBC43DRAFT_292656 [Cladorrhinum sp. PSN259]|nr:hypothetical protein QBC43DRAFT_292656 [Cladorrhinum sp. PSN259]
MARPNPSPCRVCNGNLSISQIHPECMYRLGSNQWAHAHIVGQNARPQIPTVPATIRNPHDAPLVRVSRPLTMRLGIRNGDGHWSSSGYGGGRSVNNPLASQNLVRRPFHEVINQQVAGPDSSSGKNSTPLPFDTVLDDEDLEDEDQEVDEPTRNEAQRFERRINNTSGEVEQKCTTAEHWFPLTHYKPGIGKCRKCRDNYQRLRDDRLSRNEYPRCGHPNRKKGIACPVCRSTQEAKAAERGSGTKGRGRGRK